MIGSWSCHIFTTWSPNNNWKNHLENLWQPNSVNHPQKARLDWDSSSHNSRADNTGCDKQEIIYVVALPSHQHHTPPNTIRHHHCMVQQLCIVLQQVLVCLWLLSGDLRCFESQDNYGNNCWCTNKCQCHCGTVDDHITSCPQVSNVLLPGKYTICSSQVWFYIYLWKMSLFLALYH